ncbi:hypothetical protein AAFG13_29025 [Bradyrhizobium sp. B124]|uniref:hypothetical protein n=1 Tax=Bradyrhizobium sp. B124 TaxID=3140245 RepID=UPI0031834DBC
MSLMPCFKESEAFQEGVILGRLLAGYGEVETSMLNCLVDVEGQFVTPIKELFGVRSAERRITIAGKLLTPELTKAGLQTELANVLDDMDWCRQIRNQYAHCTWYWTSHEGLCFVNLEELAGQGSFTSLFANKQPIDVALLSAQEDFFNYVKESFFHLGSAYKDWDMKRVDSRRTVYVFPKPQLVSRPALHN